MKMIFRSLGIAATLALVLTGCVSVDVAKDGDNKTVVIQNNCCKLFGCLPLGSGDPDYPNEEVCSWFEDTLTLETNLTLLEQTMRKEGASGIRNLKSYRDDEQIIPLLLKRYMLNTSAEIVR